MYQDFLRRTHILSLKKGGKATGGCGTGCDVRAGQGNGTLGTGLGRQGV